MPKQAQKIIRATDQQGLGIRDYKTVPGGVKVPCTPERKDIVTGPYLFQILPSGRRRGCDQTDRTFRIQPFEVTQMDRRR
jgi:hypothetical protein